jgi:hypothetical protein
MRSLAESGTEGNETEASSMDRICDPRVHRTVALLGWVPLVAGVLGLASAILLIGVKPSVGADHFGYPFTMQQ